MRGRDAATGSNPSLHVTQVTGKSRMLRKWDICAQDAHMVRRRGNPRNTGPFAHPQVFCPSSAAPPGVFTCSTTTADGRAGSLTAGRVGAQWLGPGVRHRKRAGRLGRGNGVGRCGAGRVRPHRIRSGLRRKRLWFMHWRDGHASPSKARVGSILLTRVQDTPGALTGTGLWLAGGSVKSQPLPR